MYRTPALKVLKVKHLVPVDITIEKPPSTKIVNKVAHIKIRRHTCSHCHNNCLTVAKRLDSDNMKYALTSCHWYEWEFVENCYLGQLFVSLRHFGYWNVSVICLTVVLKLTVTVFFSLYFQTIWPKWFNVFQSFQTHFGLWLKKKTGWVLCERSIFSSNGSWL